MQVLDTKRAGTSPASWWAVGALAASSFALVTTEFLPVGMLQLMADELATTPGRVGLSVTVPAVVAAIVAPLTIAFAGAVDRRRLLVLLLAMLAASNLLVATAQGFTQLLAGRVLLGVAVGGFWTIAGALGARLRPGSEGVRANALVLAGVSLGTVAGVPVGALISDLFHWRWSFGLAGGLTALSILAVLRLVPPLPAQARQGVREMGRVLKSRATGAALVAAMLIFVGQFAAYTYIGPFLHASIGIAGQRLGLVLLAYGGAGFLGNLAGGWLAGSDARRAAMTTAALLGFALLALPAAGAWPWVSIALVVLWGVGFGMLPISLQSWLFSTAPQRIESIQAIFVSVAQTAIGAGALVGGLLVDHSSAAMALYAGAAAALATLALIGAHGWLAGVAPDAHEAQKPCTEGAGGL